MADIDLDVRELSPFLCGGREGAASEDGMLLESVRRKATDSVVVKRAAFESKRKQSRGRRARDCCRLPTRRPNVLDRLIGMSTSGNSKNIRAAFGRAKTMGLVTLGQAGNDGGTMTRSPAVLGWPVVCTDSIHRIQEAHVASSRILRDLVLAPLADSPGLIGRGADA